MLCEKRKKVEATVHITEIVGDAPDEMKKRDFCEACFSQSELPKKPGGKTGGWTSSGPGYRNRLAGLIGHSIRGQSPFNERLGKKGPRKSRRRYATAVA